MTINIGKQLSNLYRQQQFLYMFVFGLIISIVWLVVALFSSQTETKIDKELQAMALTLNPNINETVLLQLEQKRTFTDAELQNFEILRIVEKDNRDTVVLPLGVELPDVEQVETTINRPSLLNIVVQDDLNASDSAQPDQEIASPSATTQPSSASGSLDETETASDSGTL